MSCCCREMTTYEIAAQCWTDARTLGKVMDADLAQVFSEVLDKERATHGRLYHQRAILLDALDLFVSAADCGETPTKEAVARALCAIRECRIGHSS